MGEKQQFGWVFARMYSRIFTSCRQIKIQHRYNFKVSFATDL